MRCQSLRQWSIEPMPWVSFKRVIVRHGMEWENIDVSMIVFLDDVTCKENLAYQHLPPRTALFEGWKECSVWCMVCADQEAYYPVNPDEWNHLNSNSLQRKQGLLETCISWLGYIYKSLAWSWRGFNPSGFKNPNKATTKQQLVHPPAPFILKVGCERSLKFSQTISHIS